MYADWGKARVEEVDQGQLQLLVNVRGAPDTVQQVFAQVSSDWSKQQSPARYAVQKVGVTPSSAFFTLAVWPIDENDVEGEKARVDQLVGQLEAVATQRQEAQDEALAVMRTAEQEKRDRLASLAEKFQRKA